MALLAFWNAPANDLVDRIEVWSGSSSDPSTMSLLISMDAKDRYDNWHTHYYHEAGTGTVYYQARFYESGTLDSVYPSGVGKVGVVPYDVTPQMVLDTIQGVPQNYINAELIQRYIAGYIRSFEFFTGVMLSETTATRERYGSSVYDKIIGDQQGQFIQLRHWPVISVDTVECQVRGSSASGPSSPLALAGVDAQVEFSNAATGWNHGLVTIFVASAEISALFANLNFRYYRPNRIQVLITYKHGFAVIPLDVQRAITEMTAASILEIQGEAETGGLSSRSIDGYAESFTASATTTQFSARRIWYEKGFGATLEQYKKPLWG